MTSQDVEFHLEKMLPELQDLQERNIFTGPECKKIALKRRDFEYSIHRMNVRKGDFISYISYECSLENLRKKRKLRLGLDSEGMGITLSDYSLVRRIHSLYQKVLKKFKGDTGKNCEQSST